MGGKGGGSQTIGYRYFMTIQYGLCRGPIDEIVQIKAGDKSAWPYVEGSAIPTGPTVSTQIINGDFDALSPWINKTAIAASITLMPFENTNALNLIPGSIVEQQIQVTSEDVGKEHTLSLKGISLSGGSFSLHVGSTSGSNNLISTNASGTFKFTPTTITFFVRLIGNGSSGLNYIDYCKLQSNGGYDATIIGDRVTAINAPDLFGGEKAEGGIQGSLTALMGTVSQIYPAWFKNLLGGDVPDFRGVATVIFDGMICALNPYPKEWKFRLRRTTAGWDGPVWQPTLATIWLADNKIRAMNPAHMLYECVTNRAWGRGYDRSRIGETTWVQVARTLYNEGFGLCMKWSRQDSLQSFIQEILDHIGGTLYVNRETGLLDLDLIRDNYNVEDLPLFDRNSGLLSVDQSEAATQADAISEVIVKYKDILLNETQEVRAQNLAVIQSNEGTSSKTNTYEGIPILSLAARVAQRDLRSVSASTNRYTVKLDRRAWRIRPGSVFRVSDPDMGIQNLVLRAGKVNDGTLTGAAISVEAVLDVFGLSSTAFISPEEPGWEPPIAEPQVIVSRVVREATYQELVGRLSPADLAILDVNASTIAAAGVRPVQGLLNYSIASRTGSEDFVIRGSEAFAPGALCNGALGFYNGNVVFDNAIDTGLMEVSDLIQIDNEILCVTAINLNTDGNSGNFEVLRGCVDTVPAIHPDNARIVFLGDNVGTDSREYVTSDVVDVKLLSNSSSATLNEALAPTDTVNVVGRQGRPYAPGAVFVNWTPAFNNVAATGDFRIDWTHRDRKMQADQIVGHWDANVGPEPGTTYTLRFYSSSNALIRTIAGITDNFRLFTASDNTLTGAMFVELEAMRDGLASFQKYRFQMSRTL